MCKYIKLILFAFTLIFFACKSDDIIVKPDPYEDLKKFVPKIYVKFPAGDSIFFCDTILINSYPLIEATQNYKFDYFWLFEGELEERKGNPVNIRFFEPVGPINVRLRTSIKSSYKDCNQSYWYDTTYKNIFIKPYNEAQILGEYIGSHTETPNDSFVIKFYIYNDDFVISNINRGCINFYNSSSIYKSRLLDKNAWININSIGIEYALDSCFHPYGFAQLSTDNNSITFDYSSGINLNDYKTRKRYVFKGRRIK